VRHPHTGSPADFHKGTDIFLIRRFDREKGEEDGWLRRGFMSALSLMQWDERDRPRRESDLLAPSFERCNEAL
jgi:hypothetical protein